MPYFHFAFSDVVTWYIEHEYYKEMSGKLEVVSCMYVYYHLNCTHIFVGSNIPHNENKGDDMIKIMSHFGRTVTQPISTLHSLLFGGDQLTAARIRGAQEGKCDSVKASKRFEGLIPVIEDWHTKVIVLEVSV